jgi:hypothetical protein
MKKFILSALLFAPSSFAVDIVNTDWLTNAYVEYVRVQTNGNVYFGLTDYGGVYGFDGTTAAGKNMLSTLLTIKSTWSVCQFQWPGLSTMYSTGVRKVENLTLGQDE